MKKCLLYGNCQIEPLRKILEKSSDFTKKYQFIDLKPVHLLTENDAINLEVKIAETDLFIHQVVSDDYQGIKQFGTNYLRNCLKKTAKAIAIPGAYFTGYHPAMINFKDGDGNKITKPCDYHDVNLLYLFDQGKTVTEAIEIIEQVDFYQAEYVLDNFKTTLQELRDRETELDITISDFIEQNYQKEKLFHTFNHPGVAVLSYLADRILELLELPVQTHSLQAEVLDFTAFPIYLSVARLLALDFPISSQYSIKGEILTVKNAVKLFFDFYSDNQELVKLNIIQNQEKYTVTVCGIQVNPIQLFNPELSEATNKNVKDTEDLLNCIREQSFQDLLDLAKKYYQNNLYEEAISLCQAALKIEENNIQAWRQLAYCYEAKGEISAAIDASDRALTLDPNQTENAIHQARLWELQVKTTAARELYQQAIAIDSNQPPWVYRHLGNTLMAENNPADAIVAYQQAISINPDFGAQIYLSLANAYQKQKQWQQAKDTYFQALKINPDLQLQVDNELKKFPKN